MAAYYEWLSEDYLEIWGERLHHGLWLTGKESVEEALSAFEDLLVETAKMEPESRIADVGCGFGVLARRLAHEFDADVSGWTLSSFQAEHARTKAAKANLERLSFHCQDWLACPNSDLHFDRIIAVESLSHFEDPKSFFTKAAELLEKRGRLVIADWFCSPSVSALASSLLLDPISRAGSLAPFRSVSQVIECARSSGFEVETMNHIGPQVRQTWPRLAKRFRARFWQDETFRRRWLEKDRIRRAPGLALTVLRLLIAYNTSKIDYAILTMARLDKSSEEIALEDSSSR
ncbi:MAG: class I SAM-dependent methyltransferase [Verrucomicrobiota bacterium]